MAFLAATAAGLGFASHHLLTKAEQDLADTQFDSIADRALSVAVEVMRRNRLAVKSMASIIAQELPDAEPYPRVMLPGFDTIGANILSSSSTVEVNAMTFLPIVQPEEAAEFEAFAYQELETQYGPGVAQSSFGKGIWAVNPTLQNPDKRYHDTTGATFWGSPNLFLAPILQIVGFGTDMVRLMNVHSLVDRGQLLDDIMACTQENQQRRNNNIEKEGSRLLSLTECPSISMPFVLAKSPDADASPGALVCEAILPVNDPTELTGFVCQTIRWYDILRNGFNQEVQGIQCVLETDTEAYTWVVESGEARYRGVSEKSDHYCNNNDESATIRLTPDNVYSNTSVTYSLTLCPTDQFVEVYSTSNPITATIGAVSIVFFMTLFFLLYDFVVRVEFHEKQSLLDAKRKFIRFVSHEVRTPLNSVCMGLKLLRQEVEEIIEAKEQQDQEHSGEGPYSSEMKPEAPLPESFKDAKDDEDGDDVLDLTDQITRSAEAAVHVLDDFLNFDKIESGQLQLEYTVVNIWSLVEQCVKEFRIPYRSKGVKAIIDWKGLFDDDADIEMSITSSLDLPQRLQDCRVVGDEVRITQVFRNMLSNALKFTPKGGIVIVEVSMSHLTKTSSFRGGTSTEEFTLQDRKDKTSFCRCGTVTTKVIDSGVGMTEEQLQKLFSSGVQFNVNKLQAGKGSGLGLFISKGIVEQHKGTMTADSKGLGHGTSFNIALPLYHVPDTDPIMISLHSHEDTMLPTPADGDASDNSSAVNASSRSHLSEASSSLDLKKDQHHVVSFDVHRSRRILVVDDAGINRKLLVRMLTREGHVCDQAQNGLEAVQAVQAVQATLLPRGITTSDEEESNKQRPYDVILLDYEMPVMDGPTAAMKIRDLGCSNVLIVGITGNCLKEDVEHFESHGANAVLPKPFELAALEKVWTHHDRDANKDKGDDILLFLNDQSGNTALMDESEIL